eukprot:3823345-Rhodomonas_salina.1
MRCWGKHRIPGPLFVLTCNPWSDLHAGRNIVGQEKTETAEALSQCSGSGLLVFVGLAIENGQVVSCNRPIG